MTFRSRLMLFGVLCVCLTALAFLGGCTAVDRTPPQEKPRLAHIDAALKKPCPALTVGRIPEGDQELIVAWPFIQTDLENYRACRYRFGRLVKAIDVVYANQDAGLK